MSRMSTGQPPSTENDQLFEERKTAPIPRGSAKKNRHGDRLLNGSHPQSEIFDNEHEQNEEQRASHKLQDRQKVRALLDGSKYWLTKQSLKEKSWQYFLYEKEIKTCLARFFDGLEEDFKEFPNENKDFVDSLTRYILRHSGVQSDGIQELNLLDQILKVIKVVEQSTKIESNVEKLNLYQSLVASQLTLISHKYLINKDMEEKIQQEEKYLKKLDGMKFEEVNLWCQISKSNTYSEVTVSVDEAIKLNGVSDHSSTFCIMKINDVTFDKTRVCENTKTPYWRSQFDIKLENQALNDQFTFEVYLLENSPTLIGKCSLGLEEILDNTLYQTPFDIYLPLMSDEQQNGERKSFVSNISAVLKQEMIENLDLEEVETVLSSQFNNDAVKGFLKLSFDVNLDPTFFDCIEKARKRRLSNLNVVAEENKNQMKDQYNLLKQAVSPIYTLEVNKKDGLVGKKMQSRTKGRDSLSWNFCVPGGGRESNCNIF